MTLQSISFKFFAKIMRGSCVFVVQVVLVLTLQATLKKFDQKVKHCNQSTYQPSKVTNMEILA